MSETVRLTPTKRIEGHGRVSLFVGDDGNVENAHFDVIEFRGFEKMLEGRMVWEMPLITSRVCGVCPVSHHLAAVRAVDAMFGVEIPRAAKLQRELMHLGGFSQDHALHFFFLAGPDFLLGDGAASRDVLGIVGAHPELARKAIATRRAGQRIVEIVGGRVSHPVAAIPGGVSKAITREERLELIGLVKQILDDSMPAVELARDATLRLLEDNPNYADAPVANMAQMRGDIFDLYDGTIRVMDPDGQIAEEWDASQYQDHITERVLANSYANSPYLTRLGPDRGNYRVGPLARLNMAGVMTGHRSDSLLDEYRRTLGKPVHAVLAYHWARMIELVASAERMAFILEDDEILSDNFRVPVQRGGGVGIAAIEAPRGTLIHHYEADPVGKVTKANLVVATTHNVASIDDAVLKAVKGTPYGTALTDETFRRMELGIRAHDPCLSCATHEVGRMPLVIEIIGPDGSLIGERGVE